MSDVKVPLDVPEGMRDVYLANYNLITQGSGRLMLFAGDQKMEHLNDDFYGEGIPADDGDPEHLFRIASEGKIGVFAAQLGLIARYAMDYPEVPYLVKMNSKTHLAPRSSRRLLSTFSAISKKIRTNSRAIKASFISKSTKAHTLLRHAISATTENANSVSTMPKLCQPSQAVFRAQNIQRRSLKSFGKRFFSISSTT